MRRDLKELRECAFGKVRECEVLRLEDAWAVGGAARRPVRLKKSECRRPGQRQSGAGSLRPCGTGKMLGFSQSEVGADMM